MKAIIRDKIYLTELTDPQSRRIKKALTFRNPKKDAAEQFGHASWDIPDKLELFEEVRGGLIIPRGVGHSADQVTDDRHTHPVRITTSIKTRPYQERAIRLALNMGSGVIVAPTGAGKCLGIDTPVLMFDGSIKPVQDICVGDKLIGPDGSSRNVLSLSRGCEKLYRVIPKKGERYVVNASHILSLKKTPGSDGLCMSNGDMIPRSEDIVNVNVENFAASNKTTRHCLKGWRSDAIEFGSIKKHLPVPPYILGAWLGDGSVGTPGLHKPQSRMVDAWIAYGESMGVGISVADKERCPRWSLTNGRNSVCNLNNGVFSRDNPVSEALKAAGVFFEKHIPFIYKTASINDRFQLIAGLIDSDGSISNNGFDFISVHKGISDDLSFLCRSVGLSAYVVPCKKCIKKSGFVGNYWRVSISGNTDRIPCLDKKAGKRLQKKRDLVHGISIQAIGVGDYYGFEIDGDHLFLLGDFTVTHNTTMGIEIAARLGQRCLVLVKSLDLAQQWQGAIKQFTGLECGLIGGGKWTEGEQFTVGLTQTLVKHESSLDYGLVIVDECHNIPAVQAYSVVNHQAAKYRFGLSATPQRRDNLEMMIHAALGPVAAEIEEREVTGSVLPVTVSTVRFDFQGNPESWVEFINLLAADEDRNRMLIASAIKSSRIVGTAVLTGTVAHAEKLASLAKEHGVNALLLHGQLPKKEREQGMIDAPNRPLIIGTLSLLSEGINWPHVGSIIFASPVSASVDRTDPTATRLIQTVGRGRRPFPGKVRAHVLDIIDNHPFGKAAYRKRAAIYQLQGWHVR